MQLPLPAAPDYSQALRYLGAPEGDAASRALLERCAGPLWQAASPRGTARAVPTGQLPAELTAGRDIRLHLGDSPQTLLFAATLGPGVDALLRRLAATNVAAAAAADALASALVEQVCDEYETLLRRDWQQTGLYLTGRFSPGYGDYPLAAQPVLCRLLDTHRAIGLSTAPSCMLTPCKSVTALLGIGDTPRRGHRAGCATCALRTTCAYRKRGTFCDAEPTV